MWLDDLRGEGGGNAGIECFAAALEHRHSDRSGNPVRRGDNTEGTDNLGPGGEGTCIDVGHLACSAGPPSRRRRGLMQLAVG